MENDKDINDNIKDNIKNNNKLKIKLNITKKNINTNTIDDDIIQKIYSAHC